MQRLWYRIISTRTAATGAILPSRGGRFHGDSDAEPTTYAAESLPAAWLEVSARFGGVPANPDAFCAWRLSVRGLKLADLTSEGERSRFGISEALLMNDPPPTRCRELALELRNARPGSDGILYPSVRNRPNGICLVVFLERAGSLPVDAAEREWGSFLQELRSKGARQ